MLTYTLDTNCIVALERDEPAAANIRRLIGSHDQGLACLRVVGIAASERTKSGIPIDNFSAFSSRLEALGMQNVEVLRPPCYAGISFVDWSITVESAPMDLEVKIHEVLFPNIPFDFRSVPEALQLDTWPKWLNAKCDVLTAWCHIYYRGDVLVTSDTNFLKSKKAALIALGAGEIKAPAELT